MSKDTAIFCIERGMDYLDYDELVGMNNQIEHSISITEFEQACKELKLKQLLTGNKDDKTHPG